MKIGVILKVVSLIETEAKNQLNNLEKPNIQPTRQRRVKKILSVSPKPQ